MSAYLYKIFNQSEIKTIQDDLIGPVQRCIEKWTGFTVEQIVIKNAFELEKTLPIKKNLGQRTEQTQSKNKYHSLCIPLDHSANIPILNRMDDVAHETECCEFMQKLLSKFEQDLAKSFDIKGLINSKKKVLVAVASDCGQFHRRGSGWLYVTIKVNGKQVKWLLSGDMVFSHDTKLKKMPQIKLRSFIENKPLKLTAQFGHADLSIGEFRSLKVGDVLMLDSQVNENVQILSAEDELVCNAKLGSKNGAKVVQVSKLEG